MDFPKAWNLEVHWGSMMVQRMAREEPNASQFLSFIDCGLKIDRILYVPILTDKLGKVDGDADGCADGCSEGNSDGIKLGRLLGNAEGIKDGWGEGATDFDAVSDGEFDGLVDSDGL